MRYQSKPERVEAFRILSVGSRDTDGAARLRLDNGQGMVATAELQAWHHPEVGDYWVVTDEGHLSVCPPDSFHAKYSRVEDPDLLMQAAIRRALEG